MTGDPSYARPGDDRPVGAPEATDPYATEEPTRPAPAGPDAPPRDSGRTAPRTSAPAPASIDRTRVSALWVAAIAAALVILLLLIFILQNGEQVEVALFGANPNLPLGVALLLAAVLGALVVALLGTARVVQLRHLAKKRGAAAEKTRR